MINDETGSIGTFGTLLRQLRVSRGLRQEQLAEVLGYHGASVISRLERGERLPSIAFIKGVAEKLDLGERQELQFMAAAGFAPQFNPNDSLQSEVSALRRELAVVKNMLTSLQGQWTALSRESPAHPGYQGMADAQRIRRNIWRRSAQGANNGNGSPLNDGAAMQALEKGIDEGTLPEVDSFLALMVNSGFAQNAMERSDEKARMAEWVVDNVIRVESQGSEPVPVFLDSGTTTSFIARAIVSSGLEVQMYTNNLFAAIYLSSYEHPCTLVGGELHLSEVEDRIISYSTLLGVHAEQGYNRIQPRPPIVILGTRGLDYDLGLMSPNIQHRSFKRNILQSFAPASQRLVIVCDWTKLAVEPDGNPVMPQKAQWHAIRDTSTRVVTSEGSVGERQPHVDTNRFDRRRYEEQKRLFGRRLIAV